MCEFPFLVHLIMILRHGEGSVRLSVPGCPTFPGPKGCCVVLRVGAMALCMPAAKTFVYGRRPIVVTKVKLSLSAMCFASCSNPIASHPVPIRSPPPSPPSPPPRRR